jgi:hypothetical protein
MASRSLAPKRLHRPCRGQGRMPFRYRLIDAEGTDPRLSAHEGSLPVRVRDRGLLTTVRNYRRTSSVRSFAAASRSPARSSERAASPRYATRVGNL